MSSKLPLLLSCFALVIKVGFLLSSIMGNSYYTTPHTDTQHLAKDSVACKDVIRSDEN